MYRQKVSGEKLSSAAGLGLIALIVLGAYVLNAGGVLLRDAAGFEYAPLVVWALGIGGALLVARRYVYEFGYAFGDGALSVERLFGRSSRGVATIYLRDARELGSEAAMRAKYPEARALNCALKRCPLERVALAYACEGKVRLLLFQPDAALREMISSRLAAGH